MLRTMGTTGAALFTSFVTLTSCVLWAAVQA
jgi:hypothetical protein